MSKWKLKDSAPKNGAWILVCSPGNYRPTTVRWGTYHPNAKGEATWRDDNGHKCEGWTHWMPLPTPPESAGPRG